MTAVEIIEASPHFSPGEIPGLEKMDPEFIKRFVQWREWHGMPTMITSAFRNSPTSAHGKGLAIDCMLFMPGKYRVETVNAERLWRITELWGWRGAGIYFDWNLQYRNGQTGKAVGVHVDMSPDPHKRPLRWFRADGAYYYQNVIDGYFYAKSGSRYTLDQAISLFNS